jgi:hypothetical protein
MTGVMSNADMWSLVAGFLSATFVLPIIQQPHWSELFRSLVTFAYAIVVGLGTAWFTGALDSTSLGNAKSATTAVLLVFVSAIATYKGFGQPTGIAPAIEHATSAGGSPKPESSNPGSRTQSGPEAEHAGEQAEDVTSATSESRGRSYKLARRSGSDPAASFREVRRP